MSLCFVSICLFLLVPCEPSRTTVSSTALDRVRAVHHRWDSEGTHNSSSPTSLPPASPSYKKQEMDPQPTTVGLFISTPSITQCRWKHVFVSVLALYVTFCLKVFHFTVAKENKEGERLDCWNKWVLTWWKELQGEGWLCYSADVSLFLWNIKRHRLKHIIQLLLNFFWSDMVLSLGLCLHYPNWLLMFFSMPKDSFFLLHFFKNECVWKEVLM